MKWMDRDRLAVAAALVVPIVASALLALRRDSFANTNAALVLVLVIVAVGANGDRLAGVLAALSAGLSPSGPTRRPRSCCSRSVSP